VRKALPESDLWLERRRRIASGEVPEAALAEERRSKLLALFRVPHRKMFLLCLVLAVFDMSAYWFTYSWLPGYLHEERHFSLAKSAVWMLVTRGGFLATRFGRRGSLRAAARILLQSSGFGS
jgi:predicted MFS family arabinose efflux permease